MQCWVRFDEVLMIRDGFGDAMLFMAHLQVSLDAWTQGRRKSTLSAFSNNTALPRQYRS